MTARQMKEVTFAVKAPVRPSDELIDRMYSAAAKGMRKATVNTRLSEQETWWLEENGYTVETIESVTSVSAIIIVSVHW